MTEWLIESVNADLNESNTDQVISKTFGDADYELDLHYNNSGARIGTKAVILSIESVKFPKYLREHVK